LACSRRQLLLSAAAGAAVDLAGAGIALAQPKPVRANLPPTEAGWIDGAPPTAHEGQTWGVPWPQGAHPRQQSFAATGPDGSAIPLQTWPLAFWPDGSLKWTAHAVPPQASPPAHIAVAPGRAIAPRDPVVVRETSAGIEVTSGNLAWRLSKRGPQLVQSATRAGVEVYRNLELVCLRQNSPELTDAGAVSQQTFRSEVTSAVVEQTGPVRAVVRFEGRHRQGDRAWLPFVVRLYFYAGSESARLMHTFIFDGDEASDFIGGLGVRFAAPLRDALHDRHIRLAGEGKGIWAEAVRTLTGLRRDPGAAYREAQIAGRATPPLADMAPAVRDSLNLVPAWGDITLSQPTPDGFEIRKRTTPGHPWIKSARGKRSEGLAYIGGPSGGAAIGIRNFWKSGPSQIDIRNAQSEAAEVTAWLWSPDAAPMDLRFYHDGMGMETFAQETAGLDITYEDYQKGWGRAVGVARTSELKLWSLASTPSNERLAQMSEGLAKPPQLCCRPARLHAAGVFGDWSLPDRSSPGRAAIEARADGFLDFYLRQVDQRSWYGFWDYGDVMHSYDFDRHQWRYDVGGFAWDNSELSSDLWLWYSFLRTGRADVFRMAEAMTRHTGEVDVYHLGPWRGFGTRHGVQHWADSSKQPRVSTAAYRRIYYYLTADERVGDLMRELLGTDETLTRVDIQRKVPNSAEVSTDPNIVNCGFGTTWCSFLAMWLTEWERTGDTRWRDRIVNGMTTIAALPMRWFAGNALYDLRTGKFLGPGNKVGISHLNAVFGAVEIHSELLPLVNVPRYDAAWIEYCRYYNAPPAELAAHLGLPAPDTRAARGLKQGHSRLTAYAAKRLGDPALAERAWREFLGEGTIEDLDLRTESRTIGAPTVLEPVEELATVSTNGVSQWALAAYQNLALVPASLDKVFAEPRATPRRRSQPG
jgi:hypothetical protein